MVVLLHSLWYYLSHTAFHKVPGLFFVHQFHHRFRGKSVSPSTALAVSPLEFIFAYISAFGPGMVLLKPSRATLQASLVVVMGHNLLMHFPPVEEAPGGCLASLSARRTTCRTTGTQATSFRATRCRTTTLASSCS